MCIASVYVGVGVSLPTPFKYRQVARLGNARWRMECAYPTSEHGSEHARPLSSTSLTGPSRFGVPFLSCTPWWNACPSLSLHSQINFFQDHTKVIVCPLMQAVSYIDEGRGFCTFKITAIEQVRTEYTCRQACTMAGSLTLQPVLCSLGAEKSLPAVSGMPRSWWRS